MTLEEHILEAAAEKFSETIPAAIARIQMPIIAHATNAGNDIGVGFHGVAGEGEESNYPISLLIESCATEYVSLKRSILEHIEWDRPHIAREQLDATISALDCIKEQMLIKRAELGEDD